MAEPIDPVRARRRRIARVVRLAKRTGYLALALAVAAFFVGVLTDFPRAAVVVSIIGLVTACVVLPTPIIMGYGIRAAERDDRERRV